jgi:hypothetical protein
MACGARVQVVHSVHIGGHASPPWSLPLSLSSGHGSKHTDANAIGAANWKAKRIRSVTLKPRRCISNGFVSF